MSFTELIPLGTNGFHASLGRETMSFLVLGENRHALLLDAGSGVSRLTEPHIFQRLAEFERIDIILTHYHLDHVSGLCGVHSALRVIERSMQLELWAPQAPLVDAEAQAALAQLLTPPLFPVGLEDFSKWMKINTYSTANELQAIPLLNRLDVRVRRQTHSGASAGLRFGGQLAYITDTTADDATTELIKGVDVLIQDVWVSAADAALNPILVSGHPDATSARRIAERAGIRRMLPVHHHPHNTKALLQELHAELSSPHFEVLQVEEGSSISLMPAPE